MRENANGRFRPHYIQLFYFFHVRFFPTILFNPHFPSSVHAFIFFVFLSYHVIRVKIAFYPTMAAAGVRRSIATRYIVIIIASRCRADPANHSRTSRRTFVFFRERFIGFGFQTPFQVGKKPLSSSFSFSSLSRADAMRVFSLPLSVPLTIRLSAPPYSHISSNNHFSISSLFCPFPVFLFSYFYNIFDRHIVKNASSPDGSTRDVWQNNTQSKRSLVDLKSDKPTFIVLELFELIDIELIALNLFYVSEISYPCLYL